MDVLPVAPLQEGLLFHSLFDEEGVDVYVEQLVLTLDGAVDGDRLRASWQALLDRHAALRAGFVQVAGAAGPVQIVVERAELPWRDVDVTGLDDGAAERVAAEERAARFDRGTAAAAGRSSGRARAGRAGWRCRAGVPSGKPRRVVPGARTVVRARAGGGAKDGRHHLLLDGWLAAVLQGVDALRGRAGGRARCAGVVAAVLGGSPSGTRRRRWRHGEPNWRRSRSRCSSLRPSRARRRP
ncbi:hypothetical protein B1R27_13940 [Streptomyces sp. GKU 895]|nr:hypothetical protein B1R27_13940 [Streptomyces sp. GKU 895]